MRRINYAEPITLDEEINRWAQLKAEYEAEGVAEKVAEIRQLLQAKLAELRTLKENQSLADAEPSDLQTVRSLRPDGRRRIWQEIPMADYLERLEGALIGRFAGCSLGSIVELWTPEQMKSWADYLGEPFPPQDYWSKAERPHELKYKVSPRSHFTASRMDGVPTDDDTIYTQMGLLILEEYGPNFTIEDVGEAWKKYIPYAHTAQEVALANLHAGIPAMGGRRRCGYSPKLSL